MNSIVLGDEYNSANWFLILYENPFSICVKDY